MKLRALFAACLGVTPVYAETITQAPYDFVAETASGLIDFESFPVLPEPGQVIADTLRAPGATLGAALAGQTRGANETFATLNGPPSAPARVEQNPPLPPMAIAFHAGFGSNAAFPLGPKGFAQRSGRGEGSLAFSFDAPIRSFALRLHLDYADPLGSRPAPGPVWLHFYGSDAALLQAETLTPKQGVQSFGFLSSAPITAITLSHQDPGGIAIDDIRYSLDSHTN
ncbi:hypothetical protein ALP8811_00833 [Aliiroseovarius pelagivivens]|uniref:Uncharacterized protein n=1 Tax=Aliiroseovarius pelagivivens TaxID=1639690 RepID=A0A2R8AIX5_9RHOB|nr:hypothetical protein [Aliiroseovarius pelagivivens]SPF75839.1 hypothetical protein ALP8811_00833 [Aliiroseovarius pelagivivens]